MKRQRGCRRRFRVDATSVVLLLVVIAASAAAQTLRSTPAMPTASASDILPIGPIQDATCDVQHVEEANDSQLYSILSELRHTAFFRSFAVDLDQGCPLSTWRTKRKPIETTAKSEEVQEQLLLQQEEDTAQCASAGLPDLEPDAEPACSVQGDADDPFTMSFHQLSLSDDDQAPSALSEKETTTTTTATEKQTNDDDYECDGDKEEMDDDSKPLCELTDDDMKPPTPIRDLFSSALRSIAEHVGWEDESQKQTFSWSSPSDPVKYSLQRVDNDDSCEGLPDNFWMDMCSNIKVGEGVKLVNLALNPERNTGYNGTHIWKAIYEENCITVDGSSSAPMCYEERVLYRLLSGLHASTTLSIAKNYYPPSKRKGRYTWEANPQYFMEKFEDHPDHMRNLHFSYVVLLRALQKASSFLYNYEIRTGNIVADETATVLLRRLLDSTILKSCQSVFTAFDESLMFKEDVATTAAAADLPTSSQATDLISLKQNFKGVFHNISSILDCVQCQQCKLHGKMAMLGYGTALKILFTKDDLVPMPLERNEIVALINTIAKFSESIKEVRELTHMYWAQDRQALPTSPEVDLVDVAVGLASSLAQGGHVTADREAELVQLALARNTELLVLAKHYRNDLLKFLHLSRSIGKLGGESPEEEPDAIIIGSGLAGLAAALNLLDRGGNVVILEKEHLLGGNSNKASSGINAYRPNNTDGDTIETFKDDTIRSAGDAAQLELIDTLIGKSAEAIEWLKNRVGVDLSLLAQLGGHAQKRTHRPRNGMAGAEIIYGMQKAVKAFEKTGKVKILVDTRVTRLLTDDNGRVIGVEYENLADANNTKGELTQLKAPNVVLATGGFAADRSDGSLLSKHRPEWLNMPATAGPFSTGDGISLATSLGAGTVDMDKVQIHPTGWVDPNDPTNLSKVLAAELMRGVGGILLNSDGKRFCNELGTRAYVTDQMLLYDAHYATTKKWDPNAEIPTFSLVLSSSAADDGRKHVDLYSHKGLLKRLDGISALAEWMGQDIETVRSTLHQYQLDSKQGLDEFGKTSFRGVPMEDLENEVFYAGKVTPVLHYCMGGITIDTEGNVLDENKNVIPGLHAAGEVSGGVHGNNRLGGNSLLECTVYGTIVGKKLPIKSRSTLRIANECVAEKEEPRELRQVSLEELKKHNRPEDCWIALHGVVYDMSEFAEEHPAGAKSIYDLAGKDGTDAFAAVHNEGMLGDFGDEQIGFLADLSDSKTNEQEDASKVRQITEDELKQHNTEDDCWVALHGEVFDLTEYAKTHPGGSNLIHKVAGTDGTEEFSSAHGEGKLRLVEDDSIGKLI